MTETPESEPQVVRELDSLDWVGIYTVKDEQTGEDIPASDGQLEKLNMPDPEHPNKNELSYGFTRGCSVGHSLEFFPDGYGAPKDLKKPKVIRTRQIIKIEEISDGSWIIYTGSEGDMSRYRLTGTEVHPGKDTPPPAIEQPRKKTWRNLWNLFGDGS